MGYIMLDNIIIMKYGVHAGESISNIIERKFKELKLTGNFYWGYGGTLCHPISQVQPFLKNAAESNNSVYLLLTPTKSNNYNDFLESKEFSYNKINWFPMPKNIHVYGSKYALICRDLKKSDFEINLCEYEVSVGASKGKSISEYFKGRVDKCCAHKISNYDTTEEKNILKISWIARVENAIFLK